VDANCLAAATTAGYWDYVDYVHAHSAEIGGTEKSVAKANQMLDQIALDEGLRQKVNQPDLAACVQKQDETKVRAALKEAEALGVDQTPTLYINGEKVVDVLSQPQPMDYLYRIIDRALIAAGQTPPPSPPPAAVPVTITPATAKPGS
jgi:protein-disulfide isomerase